MRGRAGATYGGDMGDPVLRCVGLERRFGDRLAVDGVGFEIAAGETYGLLGPNGSGKTTTISMVAGVLRPDAGTVDVGGDPLTTRASVAKGRVGLVPQEIALYRDLSTRENLRFFGRLQGLDRARIDRRIDAVLEIVGLADRADDTVESCSGGMQRRANIAAGLLHEPDLLILDEPTVGVDPQSRNQILRSIEALGGEGLSVLYTTHYMEEAERLCDRVGILDEGRMIAEGTRRQLVGRIEDQDRISLTAAGDLATAAARLGVLAGVTSATATAAGIEVEAPEGASVLAAVVGEAERAGLTLTRVEVREPDLESVFLSLTGRALRG